MLEDKIVKEKLRPIIPSDVPRDFAQLIRACWNDAYKERPSFFRIVDKLKNILAYVDAEEKEKERLAAEYGEAMMTSRGSKKEKVKKQVVEKVTKMRGRKGFSGEKEGNNKNHNNKKNKKKKNNNSNNKKHQNQQHIQQNQHQQQQQQQQQNQSQQSNNNSAEKGSGNSIVVGVNPLVQMERMKSPQLVERDRDRERLESSPEKKDKGDGNRQ